MGNESTPNGSMNHNTPSGDVPNTTGTPQARPGGAPARMYLNEKVVPYLLEGMKTITKEQPPNPLRTLGEFLIQKSNEVEGAAGSNKSPE
ncbi:hypothetical protein ASPZODRAFT_17806 [Penicilliopsis zonata CBS 506.65]|uniref:COMPASS complex subunit Sdc1 n=1 Tax=Penicilliopsis zonata CBS 506.65 TaxID=1073090 RepID=A0A1L9SCM9_9EURO|nr:hypothetical protein ASPZODRAFT_17806 [Penicilliopsis zonata CBS 506.65]OJJ44892.1 hypothetical protein ASPZODRAFT_17806 [Penicilliopsis zonata CBS 506.65]